MHWQSLSWLLPDMHSAGLWRISSERIAVRAVSMMYGTGMRNISAGAVIAAAYFPGEVMFPVMIGTLFQQVLAALFGKLLAQKKEKQEFC